MALLLTLSFWDLDLCSWLITVVYGGIFDVLHESTVLSESPAPQRGSECTQGSFTILSR